MSTVDAMALDRSASTGQEGRSASWRLTTLVFVVALGVLTMVALRSVELAPRFLKYQAAVETLATGEMPQSRMLDFSPLYLALSTAAARVSSAPATLLIGLQVVLAALIVAAMFRLMARRVAQPVALVVAGMVLFSRGLMVHQTLLEPEIVLLTWIVLFFVFVGRDDRGSPLVAGLFGGLAMWTRPNLLPVLLVVPVAYWLASEHRRQRLIPTLRRTALFALPIVLAMGLLMVRSARLVGDPWAPAMNPGTVFFEGTQPLSSGTSAAYPPTVAALAGSEVGSPEPDAAHRHYREVAAASVDGTLNVRENNAFWQQQGVAFLRAEPGFALRRWLDKLTLAFHDRPLHDTIVAWATDRVRAIPVVPFALLVGLAVIGLLRETRNLRTAWLFYALFASQLALMVLFYVSARQRLALLPALAYFAAVGIETIARPRGWRFGLLAALVAIALLVPNAVIEDASADQARSEASTRMQVVLAEAIRRDGPAPHRDRVLTWLTTWPSVALARRPAFLPQDDMPFVEQVLAAAEARGGTNTAADRFDHATLVLAAALAETGVDAAAAGRRRARLAAADRAFNGLLEEGYAPDRPGRPRTLAYDRARIAFADGATEVGVDWLRQGLEASPGDPYSLALLIAHTDDATARAQLTAYWSRADADWLLGRAYLASGRPRMAIEHLSRLAEDLPALRAAQIDLAAALAEAGRDDAAVARFLAANNVRREPVLYDPVIPNLFRRWHGAEPTVQRTIVTAQVLHVYGYLGEALALLESVETPITSPAPNAPMSLQAARAVRDEAARIRRAQAAIAAR